MFEIITYVVLGIYALISLAAVLYWLVLAFRTPDPDQQPSRSRTRWSSPSKSGSRTSWKRA